MALAGSRDVNANTCDAEGSGHFLQRSAITAADVEHAVNRKRIAAYRLNDTACVAQETVNRGDVTMDARR